MGSDPQHHMHASPCSRLATPPLKCHEIPLHLPKIHQAFLMDDHTVIFADEGFHAQHTCLACQMLVCPVHVKSGPRIGRQPPILQSNITALQAAHL